MGNALGTSVASGPCPYCQISGSAGSRIGDEVPTQCSKNRNGTCFGCQKLSDVERRIEETRRALSDLLDEREALASTLNEHHDPFSTRLPVEVISQIFLHCRTTNPAAYTSCEEHDEKQLIKSVYALTHVCRNWRKIAQGTPKLWTIVCATLTRSNCLNSPPLLNDWLKHSRGLPLFVQLGTESYPCDVVISATRKVIISMTQHAQRWNVLDLSIPCQLLSWTSSLVERGRLDCLEHVKLDSTDDQTGDNSDVLSLQASPRLITQRGVSSYQLSMNRDQLTHFFGLDIMDAGECVELLQVAHRLTFCDIKSVDGRVSGDISVTSRSLKTLVVGYFLGAMWNTFTFPSLEVLHVICPNHHTSWIHLQTLLRRSECNLQELVIHHNQNSQQDVIEILKLTPNLRRLEVEGNLLSETFFSDMDEAATSMSATRITPGFLDNLVTLTCATDNGVFKWTWVVVFLNTMLSRSERSFQSLKFRYQRELSDETVVNTLQDRRMLRLVLEASKNVDVEVSDESGLDLLDLLRRRHNM